MKIEQKIKTAIIASLPKKLAQAIEAKEILIEKPKSSNFGD